MSTLRHHAFIHTSDEEYVERTVAFLRDGLAAGERCMVGNTRDGLATVREALGPDASRVTFLDIGTVYTRPARTIATYFGAFGRETAGGQAVRAVASASQYGPTAEDWNEFTVYEAITNVAYAHLPVWVVCAYDANRSPERLLDAAWQTHPEVFDDHWQASDTFEDPPRLVRRLTRPPEELPQLRSFAPGDDLDRFREQLARELAREQVSASRTLEMLVAGTEIAANAVRHGGGIEAVRAGRVDGRFVCEVVDRGPGFDDPMAGYRAPRGGSAGGLWVARQLTWRIESFHSRHGFTVRAWL
ncbi:sensor histidine kinase [Solirubrobacter ginsenosidimutans]|uniref:Sensor histidine kinase n=1 Tax=Solirubrobacter ginsenosidimutans TaxID=490573 RepID=A0A9X3RYQ2_9ACTN|nr:sensor histidine kinase [Solirubrobacter ginsenosidimutans]MDA0159945.1 sensor histidine kinase [Solirubrobacter ginsenosidimutans]